MLCLLQGFQVGYDLIKCKVQLSKVCEVLRACVLLFDLFEFREESREGESFLSLL